MIKPHSNQRLWSKQIHIQRPPTITNAQSLPRPIAHINSSGKNAKTGIIARVNCREISPENRWLCEILQFLLITCLDYHRPWSDCGWVANGGVESSHPNREGERVNVCRVKMENLNRWNYYYFFFKEKLRFDRGFNKLFVRWKWFRQGVLICKAKLKNKFCIKLNNIRSASMQIEIDGWKQNR